MIAGAVIGIVATFYILHGDVRVIETNLDNTRASAILVQDAQRKRDAAQDIKIDGVQDDAHKIHTSQEVLKGYAEGTQQDVQENKALLNDISRSINELIRQNR